MAFRESQYLGDENLKLEDGAAAITAARVGQVSSSNQVLDMGGGDQSDPPLFVGDVVFDISAIDIANSDELYTAIVEGSSSSTFASDIEELGSLRFGDNVVITGGTDVDTTTGRYVLSVRNERNGRRYRYLRVNFLVAGTTPSITLTANLHQRKHNR